MPKKIKHGGIVGKDGNIRYPRLAETPPKQRAADKKIAAPAGGFSKQLTNRSRAFDYFQNVLARMGANTASLPEATQYELERLSNNWWLLLTLYRNHWIARRVVDLPAQDMTRAWPKLQCDMSPEDIAKFDRTVQRTYTPQQVLRALKWSRLYGGAGCLMAIKGHEDILDEPLDLDDVDPGSYRGLIPFDRWVGIIPTGDATDDIDRPQDWGMPEYYECTAPDSAQSFKVHSSRILRFLGPEVPTPELQAQIWWGISILEVIWEELKKRDNASFAILNLLFRANLIARKDPELAQVLSGLSTGQKALQRYQQTMQAQNDLLSNQSMLILGKDGEMSSVQYSFAGMGDVYAQFQMDIAGASEIPVTRLFGRTISGLGQSNDADERYYEERIAQEQNSNLRPQLDKLYPVICASEFGEVPDDLDYIFPSIRVLAEEDKAELVNSASAPILAAYNSGIISQQTAAKELKQLGETTNVFTNITDEDIAKMDDEPMVPGEMEGGAMPGEEGEPGEEAKEGPEQSASKKSLPNPQRLLKKASAGAEDSAMDEFKESDHPREKGGPEAGQFTSGSGGGSSNEEGEKSQNSTTGSTNKATKNLSAALKGWTQGDLMVGDDVASLVKKGKGKPVSVNPADGEAEAMLHGIRNGKDFGDKPLYRGMWLPEGEMTKFDRLKPGKTFDINGAASFTTNEKVGKMFASKDTPTNTGQGEGKNSRGIMFEVSGARGLEVGDKGDPEFSDQDEVVTNGAFKVESMSWVNMGPGRNTLVIKAKHLGTH